MVQQQRRHKSATEYVIAITSEGAVLGKVRRQTATGLTIVETIDGKTIELTADNKAVASLPPSAMAEVAFAPEVFEDVSATLDYFLDLYRGALETAEERRAWALKHGIDLPDEKLADELIKFRYEQHRRLWAAAFSSFLEIQLEKGNSRPLIAALDLSVPVDARRVGLKVAIERKVTAAVSLLCAAVIHKKQAAFAREAVFALSHLAPERLALLKSHVSEEIGRVFPDDAFDNLAEARFLGEPVDHPASPEVLATLSLDRLANLLIASPADRQRSLWTRLANDRLARPKLEELKETLWRGLRPLVDRESPTVYESVLRAGLAKAVITEPSIWEGDRLRTAARAAVRDLPIADVVEVILASEPTMATTLIRTAIDEIPDRVEALLAGIGDLSADMLAGSAERLRVLLENEKTPEGLRVRAIKLLARAARHQPIAAREATKILNSGRNEASAMARIVVAEGLRLDTKRLNKPGRALLLNELHEAAPSYAADCLRELREMEAVDWSEVAQMRLPADWSSLDGPRSAILSWLPAVPFGAITPFVATIGEAIVHQGAEGWVGWPDTMRKSAAAALSNVGVDRRALLFSEIVERSPADVLAKSALAEALSEKPELTKALPKLEATAVSRILLERASKAFEASIRDASKRESASLAGVSRLIAELDSEIARGLQAFRPDDTLAVLLTRMREDIRTTSIGTTDQAILRYQREAQGDDVSRLSLALAILANPSRLSPGARAHLHKEIARLVGVVPADTAIRFARDNLSLLGRVEPASIHSLIVRLVQAQAIEVVMAVLDGITARDAAYAAIRLWPTSQELATKIAGSFGSDSQTIASVLAELLGQPVGPAADPADPLSAFGHRIGPILSSIDGIMLGYMRVRRVLAQHGLEAAEPILAVERPAAELRAGIHRSVGDPVTRGSFEILTHGLRRLETGHTIMPSSVGQTREPEGGVE